MKQPGSRRGWSFFTTGPGEAESMECRVCFEKMTVERNVMGPASFGEAMGGGTHLHDRFRCPNSSENWHGQAMRILELAEETPSNEIAKILRLEADQIVRQRFPTKPEYQ